MKNKIRNFYEEHKDDINTALAATGASAGLLVITYLTITPFMIWWKKLGLYDKQ